MRSRPVKRLHPADTAKRVLGNLRIKPICGEYVVTLEDFEILLGDNQVQIASLGADGAVAFRHFDRRRSSHLEANLAAVTTPCVKR